PAGKGQDLVKKFGTKPGSIQFPLLSNPSSIFGLLMGKDVDLFLYDLPSLDLQFLYEQMFPLFPGLNAKLGGEVTATTNITFGLNTRGFNAFRRGPDGISGTDDDYAATASNIALIFTQGFFLSDHVTLDGQGHVLKDLPEATLTAKIIAGASLGIGGLVEVGVEGYVKAQVNFDLNDVPT